VHGCLAVPFLPRFSSVPSVAPLCSVFSSFFIFFSSSVSSGQVFPVSRHNESVGEGSVVRPDPWYLLPFALRLCFLPGFSWSPTVLRAIRTRSRIARWSFRAAGPYLGHVPCGRGRHPSIVFSIFPSLRDHSFPSAFLLLCISFSVFFPCLAAVTLSPLTAPSLFTCPPKKKKLNSEHLGDLFGAGHDAVFSHLSTWCEHRWTQYFEPTADPTALRLLISVPCEVFALMVSGLTRVPGAKGSCCRHSQLAIWEKLRASASINTGHITDPAARNDVRICCSLCRGSWPLKYLMVNS